MIPRYLRTARSEGEAPEAGAPDVTSEMLDAGMAIVWATDIMRESELREMLPWVYIVMSRIRG
jgi:hypothetical protein